MLDFETSINNDFKVNPVSMSLIKLAFFIIVECLPVIAKRIDYQLIRIEALAIRKWHRAKSFSLMDALSKAYPAPLVV